MHRELLRKEVLASNLIEAQRAPQDRGFADVRQERETKENESRKLIVEVAERLFRQFGFQKTTVADIARELNMSPANVYRFFKAKSEISEAVCMDLLSKIEAEAEKIAASRGTAAQKIRNLLGSVEKTHHQLFMFDRKLHDLIEAAIAENWAIMRRHTERMAAILEQIIASGMASAEFPAGDAALASRLVNTACIRFCHPRLIVEYEQERAANAVAGHYGHAAG
jgi:AcrR family transcriptional regulator